MRRKARVDANQSEIVGMLRKLPGVTVAVTSALGDGFVDIVIGRNGFNWMVELKDGNKPPSSRKLTTDELAFKDKWKGQYNVCNSFDEILLLINHG